MKTGYGLGKNVTWSIDQLKDFGRGQSIEQDHDPLNYPNPDGSWNNNGNGLYTGLPKKPFDKTNP